MAGLDARPPRPGVAALCCSAAPRSLAPAQAQYFGRNKVQYESFDWQVLHTQHFDIYFYSRPSGPPADLRGAMAERWYTRLSTVLHHELSGRQPLMLYATQAQFEQTNVVQGIGEGTGGVTEALRRRIVLPTGGTLGRSGPRDRPRADPRLPVRHDRRRRRKAGAPPSAANLPLWFIEGMAEYLSLGPVAPLTAMWMRGAVQDTARDSLPTYRQLDDPRYFPYRYGQALLAYVGGTYGDDRIGELLRDAGRQRGRGPGDPGRPQPHARPARRPLARGDACRLRLAPGRTELPDRYGPSWWA